MSDEFGNTELMSQQFVDGMYNNMWSFFNPNICVDILKKFSVNIDISYQKDINNDHFTNRHRNTICFKGKNTEGHYVYVKEDCQVVGTFESGLIYEEDDGVCHGGAILAALVDNGINQFDDFCYDAETMLEFHHNYRIIMNLYIYIIQKGWWDEIIEHHFPGELVFKNEDDKLSYQSKKALKLMREFNKNLI